MWQGKKFFVCLLLVVALVPLAANATVTRVYGLGGADANYVVHDAYNPAIWPQLIHEYPYLAGGEFYEGANGWDLHRVYANYSFGEAKSTVQFMLDKTLSSRYTTMPTPGGAGTPNRLMLTYGRPMSDWLVGLALSYEGQSAEHKVTGGTWKASNSIIGLKLGATGLEKKLDLALAFEMAGFKIDSAGTEFVKNDGSMMIGFTGRYWYAYSDKCALIPVIAVSNMVDGAKYAGSPQPAEKYTTMMFKIGAGHNWTPRDNMLVLFDFGFQINSVKSEFKNDPNEPKDYTESWNSIPYWRLGFETEIFGWLDGRIGAEKKWAMYSSDEAAAGEPKSSDVMTDTFLGATAHWNRLVLDLLVSPDFLNYGPYFISGATTNDVFSRVSLKYDFNQ